MQLTDLHTQLQVKLLLAVTWRSRHVQATWLSPMVQQELAAA